MRPIFLFILSVCHLFAFAQVEGVDFVVNDSILLNEVLVKADKKLVAIKADRYIVDAVQIRIGKNNLSDLLRDVPGVVVNKNNVGIIGKGSVKVMINGKLKHVSGDQITNLLRSYNASQVKSVEVIYNSGAEYDASGDFGILNFVMERPKVDFVGGDVSNTFTISDYASNETGLNLNFNRKKLSSFLSLGYNYAKEYDWQESEYLYTDLYRNSISKNWNRQSDWRARLGVDYDVDEKSLLNIDVSFSDNQGRHNGTDSIQSHYSAKPMDYQLSNYKIKQPQRYWNAGIYFDRKWNKALYTRLMLDYYNRKETQDYTFSSEMYNSDGEVMYGGGSRFQNDEWRHLKGFSYSFDMDWQMPSSYTLKAGTKGSFSSVGNESVYDYSNMDTQDNGFDYDEDCLAAYLLLTKTYFNCMDVRFGGRFEFTFTKGVSDIITDKSVYGSNNIDYGHLFPDLQLSFLFKETNRVSLSYNGSITRPWMSYLNPFRLYSSPYVAKEGTPRLLPSYFNKTELTYQRTVRSGFLRLYAAYVTNSNNMAEVLNMIADGTSLYKWANAYDQKELRLGYMFNYSGWRWMRVTLNGAFYRKNPSAINGYEGRVEKSSQFFQSVQLSFTFDKNQRFTGSLFGSVMSPRKTPFEKQGTYSFLRGGLNYSCLNDKLGLGLYVYNIVPVSPSGTYYSTKGMTTRYKDHSFRTSVGITLSYTFGKDIQEKQKAHSSSEVTGRF